MSAISGKGPTLPLSFNGVGDEAILAEDEVLIDSALRMIFGIEPGERPMEKTFGVTLPQLLFYNFDQNIATIAGQMTNDALRFYEDRIAVDKINIIFDPKIPDTMTIKVDFTNLGTGQSSTTSVGVGVTMP